MVCTRSRAAAKETETPVAPKPEAKAAVPFPVSTPPVCDESYERCREERIRANLEKMQKLGIVDLSLKIKAENKKSFARPGIKSPPSVRKVAQLPSRRSTRLKALPSVSYSEMRPAEVEVVENEVRIGDVRMGGDGRSVIVDGQVLKGRRVYCKINGKTCHQCRQKTLRCHTRCSRCEGVQGQFCGPCLRARYGEHILEVLEKPDWICPVCRGICNCSFCRMKKGLAPTGQIFHKVSNLGFKSVSHYLKKPAAGKPQVEVSAKRSLSFAEDGSEDKASSSNSSAENSGLTED